jgi:plasmid stabilization system protein ParE
MSREARHDLREAYDYYEAAEAKLGDRFVHRLVEALRAISERPHSFPIQHLATRRAIVKDFPYGVFFSDEETHVQVVAIVHLHRHPRHWRRRAR